MAYGRTALLCHITYTYFQAAWSSFHLAGNGAKMKLASCMIVLSMIVTIRSSSIVSAYKRDDRAKQLLLVTNSHGSQKGLNG